MQSKGKLIVITGPSGVGKSTIVQQVLARTGAAFSVSATTRSPRDGELDKKDYFFIDRNTFQSMVAAGEMLEWAEVFGQMYGTPAGPVLEMIEQGRSVILEIDVQGGLQVHKKVPDATFVLIAPPSMEKLRQRLAGRGSETPEQLETRFSKAQAEIQAARESGIYTIEVINDDLETAIQQVVDIVTQE